MAAARVAARRGQAGGRGAVKILSPSEFYKRRDKGVRRCRCIGSRREPCRKLILEESGPWDSQCPNGSYSRALGALKVEIRLVLPLRERSLV